MKNCRYIISFDALSIFKVVSILVLFYVLWLLRDLVLILFASIVIASAITPAAKFLTRFKIPRSIAVLIVYFAFFASFFAIMYFFVPTVLQQTGQLLSNLPTSIDKINSQDSILPSFIDPKSLTDAINKLNEMFIQLKSDNFAIITTVFGGLVSFILVVVLSFYFAVNEKGVEEFIRTITPIDKEKMIISLWERSQKKMGLWLQGQLLLALIIGVMVFLGLSILGVPYALPLAVLAGFMELIPVFGPILAAIPALAIAFIDGGLSQAIIVGIYYTIVQQFENNLIYPLVVTKVVGVPPLLVILALIAGAKLAGFMGALLAIPFAAILQEIFVEMDRVRKKELQKMRG